ncbi:heterokaryon incompatibility, partial [Paraphoma chrysanthemicola]
MRLLCHNGRGGFDLREFHGNQIPPYAILSHTWGADRDEVTFHDVIEGRGTEKPGYKKLQFCGQKAYAYKLDYFWVDTCCINKLSDQELSESINSMFHWYQRAVICFVYLTDFEASHEGPSSARGKGFGKSRWFSRGWTLQEILAANKAVFFDSSGRKLGDKCILRESIAASTGISERALRGPEYLRCFGVEERLSWAQYRQTKREEDMAYSLLGIFDVSMPLVYGEGRNKAYERLFEAVEA